LAKAISFFRRSLRFFPPRARGIRTSPLRGYFPIIRVIFFSWPPDSSLSCRACRFAFERLEFLPQLPLPQVILPEKVGRFLGLAGGPLDLKTALEPLMQGVPTAPVWVGLFVTLALLAVAARLWEEVEWA